MAGLAVFDGQDTGYMIPGKRDTGGQGEAGSGFENIALRDTGFSILLAGCGIKKKSNRILLLTLFSLGSFRYACKESIERMPVPSVNRSFH